MVLLIVAESWGAWYQLCCSKQHYLCEWHWWIFPYSLSLAMLLMLFMDLAYHTKIVCSGEFVNESLGPLLLSDLIQKERWNIEWETENLLGPCLPWNDLQQCSVEEGFQHFQCDILHCVGLSFEFPNIFHIESYSWNPSVLFKKGNLSSHCENQNTASNIFTLNGNH